MKRIFTISIAFLILLAGSLGPQVIQHETKTINVEVPVRVYKGAEFVDHLNLEDFEIYDNGRRQKLEAVYLIKKAQIERREETQAFAPRTARHFTLMFEMIEYDARINEGLDFFVKNVLIPGDSLIIVTPVKTYRMRAESSLETDREKILRRLIEILRRDILLGNAEYRELLGDLKSLARVLASTSGIAPATGLTFEEVVFPGNSFEENLEIYATILQRLESLRWVDQKRFLDFADYLKTLDGQKDVFLFYQREFVPKIEPKLLSQVMSLYTDRVDILLSILGYLEFSRRPSVINTDFIKKAYADSSTAVHFLFLSTPAEAIPGIVMEERTEDIYEPFREMARVTGGFSDTSANFAAIMRSAAAALENYYLLYYTPDDYRADGAFREIEVRVKSGGYRVGHRGGYIAD